MKINHSNFFVTCVLNELKDFLKVVKGCDCLDKSKLDWEVNSQMLYQNTPHNKCTNSDLNITFIAFKRLVDNLVLMEETLKKSFNEQSYEITKKDLPTSRNSVSKQFIPYSDDENTQTAVEENEPSVVIDIPLVKTKKPKNVCKYCRRRFSTKQLLSYHMIHLHKNIKPG